MQPLSVKEKAIAYRKRGYSYSMISHKLGLAKSTLSDWLKEVPYRPNKATIKRIKLGPMQSGIQAHKKRIKNILEIKASAKKEIGKLTKRDLWMLGIGLYWGEGTKLQEASEISNSDPAIVKMTIKWFQDICNVPTKNFNVAVHAYPDNNIKNTIKYWQRVTGISRTQFGKTQIDTRTNKSGKKRRKLPYGTLRVNVQAKGQKELGVQLHRRIMGWIEAVLQQV